MNYYNEHTLVYLNGEWLPAASAQVTLYNQTMHYGNGIFEGIRSYKTPDGVKVFKAKEHYERFIKSAQLMYIPVNNTVEEFIDITYQLLEKNNMGDAYIRPLLFLDPNMSLVPVEKSNLFMCAWEWGKYLGSELLRIGISKFERPNPKSCHIEAKAVGHYTNSILASTEAKRRGYDEALLLDSSGHIAEGPGANFFYEKNGVLYTCPLGNILPGITRNTIIELAEENGIKVVVKLSTPEEVKTADSAFFTGTAAEVAGIQSLDEYVFPLDWDKSIGRILQQKYSERVLR